MTIKKTILETCDIWDTDYNSDNWEPEFVTIIVYLAINCDTGQHSQFLRCFWQLCLVVARKWLGVKGRRICGQSTLTELNIDWTTWPFCGQQPFTGLHAWSFYMDCQNIYGAPVVNPSKNIPIWTWVNLKFFQRTLSVKHELHNWSPWRFIILILFPETIIACSNFSPGKWKWDSNVHSAWFFELKYIDN